MVFRLGVARHVLFLAAVMATVSARADELLDASIPQVPFVETTPLEADHDAGEPRDADTGMSAWALDASLVSELLLPQPVGAPVLSNLPETLTPGLLDASIVEVTVRSGPSSAKRLQTSSEAVTVVSLETARKRTSDLGEVLTRIPGVSVRRTGGLGSDARLSINGLYDRQVRVFVDGVPIEYMFSQGLASIPINLLKRADVYRGVVPIRLGADALGGAINLIRPEPYVSGAKASYQVGSFGMHRATLGGVYHHEPSGFIAALDAFIDHADNDYFVNVEIGDLTGRLTPARVRRFHDGYDAMGIAGEVGLVDRSWAKRLTARAYASIYDKQLQNNVIMTVPYGDVRYGERVQGALLRYQHTLFERLDLDIVGNYSYRSTYFVDKGSWVYDWRGERLRQRAVRGEIEGRATDQIVWQHGVFSRATGTLRLTPGHSVVFTVSPNFTTRSGDERIQADPTARDPLTATKRLITVVSGASYDLNVWPMPSAPSRSEDRQPEDYRIENSLFVKSYLYRANSEEPLSGGRFVDRNTRDNRFGIGDSLRVFVTRELLFKASYELATRLPTPDEVFGDAVLVRPNLLLSPETSHNANVGPHFRANRSRIGMIEFDLNAFLRKSERLIVLLGDNRYFTYQNVYAARSLGLEGALNWTSIGRWISADASMTWQNQRNDSNDGPFASFKGDRIPNRPWLFAAWGLSGRIPSLITRGDELTPFYLGRYVHEFYRGWESAGSKDFKETIDAQISHGIGVTYGITTPWARLDTTFEVQNLTDARLYDSFGVQRPGRAFYLKVAGEL